MSLYGHSRHNVMHIVAAIIGLLVAFSVLVAIYIYRRRRILKKAPPKPDPVNVLDYQTEEEAQPSAIPHQSSETTPSMQQQQLQYKLQRQHHSEQKATPPPPYAPYIPKV
ncbi:hypothetical protein DFQ29_002401 [Apophysomyces sp. BC1021]|nr:hypothetical protein DFQ29_002401 [Apophysomyces sp. BC1021]